MGIKSDVKLKPPMSHYPYIGRHRDNGRVVLFVNSNSGTVLARGDSTNHQEVGFYAEHAWVISDYDYIESILLTNT